MFMLLSIFSSFDLTYSFSYMYVMIMVMLLFMNTMWLKTFNFFFFFLFVVNLVVQDMKSLSMNLYFSKLIYMLLLTFVWIMLINVFGLFPFIFSLSSHLMMTLSTVLLLWLGIMTFMLMYNMKNFLIHLLPVSTPLFLCMFMVVIEFVSQLIRPITLSVRLAANMTAGHILLILLSSLMIFINLKFMIFGLLVMLELAVAFIQAYVFCILLTMYLLETN